MQPPDSSNRSTVLRFALHPKQRAFYESNARFAVACAGARGGKTTVGGGRFARLIIRDHARLLAAGKRFRPPRRGVSEPLMRLWVGGPEYGLTRVAQQELSRIFDESNWRPAWAGLSQGIYHECELGRTGILIEFKSADRPNTLVSVPTHGQWWDESARLKSSVWPLARQRLIDTGGWAQFTTSPLPGWFHEDCFKLGTGPESKWYDPTKTDPEWRSWHWTTADNPAPQIQADVALAMRTMPRRFVQRDLMADPEVFFGQVYEEFASDHIIDDVGRFDEVIGGVDFGHSAPGCVLVVGVRRRFAPNGKPAHRYHVLAEVYADRWVTSQWIDATLKLCTSTRPQITALYCDPAGAQLIADWKNAGLPVATHPSINDVSGGIRHMATLFAQGRLTVSPKCVNLIRELRAYRYREDSAGNTIDVVVKANDHAPDAARYALFADHLRHAA